MVAASFLCVASMAVPRPTRPSFLCRVDGVGAHATPFLCRVDGVEAYATPRTAPRRVAATHMLISTRIYVESHLSNTGHAVLRRAHGR